MGFGNEGVYRFFVIAKAIGGVYSLVLLFIPTTILRRLFLALDMVVTMLLAVSVAAAVAVGEVGRNGDYHAGWPPICDQVPKFCNHVMGALILGFFGVCVHIFLLLHAIQMGSIPL